MRYNICVQYIICIPDCVDKVCVDEGCTVSTKAVLTRLCRQGCVEEENCVDDGG
jgi:hypothetical protein